MIRDDFAPMIKVQGKGKKDSMRRIRHARSRSKHGYHTLNAEQISKSREKSKLSKLKKFKKSADELERNQSEFSERERERRLSLKHKRPTYKKGKK